MSNYLLFDIGGTNTRVAASFDENNITDPIIYRTPQNYMQGIEELVKAAKSLSSESYDVVGGGIAGPLNKDKDGIINAPNLQDWNGKPFISDLKSHFDTKIIMENDTALVGLGEAVVGAGKDYEIVVYITISTGVNGVRIVNKRLDEHRFGFEIGKQILEVETDTSWEEILSSSGDIGEKEIDAIATGVYNSILFWSPDVIVMGGGKMKSIEIEKIASQLQNVLKVYPEIPDIRKSELGEMGGLYGALSYLRQSKY